MTEKFQIRGDSRALSTYMVGNPGSGKSTLIQNMALQDIQNGWGVCVIDPHRDLITEIIHRIPERRIKDTVWFDTEDPVPIDFLSYTRDKELEVLTDQLTDIFALEGAPISKPLVAQIITAVLEANHNPEMPEDQGCTFLDIKNFIEDETRRHLILDYAPRFKSELPDSKFKKLSDFESITGRLRPFTTFPSLQKIMECPRPRLNIEHVMNGNKIFLVSLDTNPTDYFIASLIVSKFHQATFARKYIPESERNPFYLYVDECHETLKFCEHKFQQLLTGARKYGLCLTLSNQLISDLPKGIRDKLPLIYTKIKFVEKGLAHLTYGKTTSGLYTSKPPAPNPHSFAMDIRDHTSSTYRCTGPTRAQSGTKRTGDNSSSQTTLNPSELEEDGKSTLLRDEAEAPDPRKSGKV